MDKGIRDSLLESIRFVISHIGQGGLSRLK